MLVIGLAGSTLESREAVARRLHEDGGRQLVVWAMTGYRIGDGRANTLARALEGAKAGRQPVEGLVFTHVLTEEEARVIRKHGGFVWHVCGMPSNNVVIRQGDLLVTETEGGERHFLDPIEALSEVLLARGAAA